MKPNTHKGSTLRTVIQTLGVEKFGRFYGVYYGIVKGNVDPLKQGRLLLYIPEIFGTSLNFRTAYPRGSVAGEDFGFHYRPKAGETVVVTFRFGDPKLPLWEPSYWGKGEMPEEFDSEDKIGFKSRNGSVIIMDDEAESITVYNKAGHTVKIEKDKITIGKDSKIVLEDNQVHISNGAIDEPAVLGDSLKEVLQDILSIFDLIQVDPGSHKGLPIINTEAAKVKVKLSSILAKFST